MREKFEKWLSDGLSWIGVYENSALDSYTCGQRVALTFWLRDWDKAKMGTRAPDVPSQPVCGCGWKWLLVAKCKTVDEALEAMKEEHANG